MKINLHIFSFSVLNAVRFTLVAPAARCKAIHLHRLGILTFNNLLNHTIINQQHITFRTIPTVLVYGLIKDFN